MATLTHTLGSLEETRAFGLLLAGVLRPGDALLLDGPLGAGKTTLARAVAEGLGVAPGLVSSPTFVIAQEYRGAGGVPVVHADAYRLTAESDEELDLLGWDRLSQGGAIVLVEWAERIAGRIARAGGPEPALLRLTPVGETTREAALRVPASWVERPGWRTLSARPAGEGDVTGEGRGRGRGKGEDAGPATRPREATVCRVTGRPVPADSPTWPFADERARMADLYRWFSEGYTVSRPIERTDIEEDE